MGERLLFFFLKVPGGRRALSSYSLSPFASHGSGIPTQPTHPTHRQAECPKKANTFCSPACVHEHRLRTDGSYVRKCLLVRLVAECTHTHPPIPTHGWWTDGWTKECTRAFGRVHTYTYMDGRKECTQSVSSGSVGTPRTALEFISNRPLPLPPSPPQKKNKNKNRCGTAASARSAGWRPTPCTSAAGAPASGRSVCLPVCLSVCLTACLSLSLSLCLFVCLSVCMSFSLSGLKTHAGMRDRRLSVCLGDTEHTGPQ